MCILRFETVRGTSVNSEDAEVDKRCVCGLKEK